MKGIVVERKKRYDIVMAAEGGFYKTKIDSSHAIGEEVQFTPLNNQAGLWSTARSYLLSPQLKTAAAILICLAVIYPLLTWTNNSSETYAYVNIDINPSFSIEVNDSYRILNVQGLNEDGTELLSELDNLEGESLQEVSTSIVTKSRDMGYLDIDRNILLGVNYAGNQANDQDTYLETLSNELSTAFDDDYEFSLFEVPDEIREQAEEEGTSMNILFASDQIMNQTSGKASNDEEQSESDQGEDANNQDEDDSDQSEANNSSSENQDSQSNQSLNNKLQRFLEGMDRDDLPSGLRDKLEGFKSDNEEDQSNDDHPVFGDEGPPGHRDDDDSEEDQNDDNEDDHPVFGNDGPPGHNNDDGDDSEEDRNHNQDDQDEHQENREEDGEQEDRNKKGSESGQDDDHPVFGDDGPLDDNEEDDESSDNRERDSDEEESEEGEDDDNHPVFGDDGPPGQNKDD